MQDLLILGTGVHAAEMAEIAERVNRVRPTWNLLGYVTSDDNGAGGTLNGYPIVGAADVLAQFPSACLVPDNDWPRSINIPQERLVSLIDPSAFISRTAVIGNGCVIYPNCYIGLNVKLGDYVFCLSGSIINHDNQIGDKVVIASAVTIAGNVSVEDDCYLGQACNIKQFVTIGLGSLIGMGSVVVNDVPPHSVMTGNPARKLRDTI